MEEGDVLDVLGSGGTKQPCGIWDLFDNKNVP